MASRNEPAESGVADVDVELELGSRRQSGECASSTERTSYDCADGVDLSPASTVPAKPSVSVFTWVQLCLLSAAWACAFSGLTASVASISVASKQVLHEDALSTLPTALVLFMTGLANIFIAWEVQALGGRKWASVIGAAVGVVSSGLIALAIARRSFVGVCLASTLMGFANAHGQLYRFAAVEFVPPSHQPTAIAIVLSGGIVGAVVGPEYSKRTKASLPEHPFVGTFLASIGVYALNLILILIIRFPPGGFVKPTKADARAPPSRASEAEDVGTDDSNAFTASSAATGADADGPPEPARGASGGAAGPGQQPPPPSGEDAGRGAALLQQQPTGDRLGPAPASAQSSAPSASSSPRPRSLLELLSPVDVQTSIAISAISYGVMCFLMLPVPLAMTDGGFSFADSAVVVQAHMIAMYLPSFLSGSLVSRLGASAVQVLGAVVLGAGTIAFLTGIQMEHYSIGEILNGLGWNLLFSGATNTLASAASARALTPAERTRVQAANDLCVFVLAGVGSFTSAIVLRREGWAAIQYASQGTCGLMLLLLARAHLRQRREAAAAAAGKGGAEGGEALGGDRGGGAPVVVAAAGGRGKS